MDKVTRPTERIMYLDYLRIFATFAVVIVHVSTQNQPHVAVTTSAWRVFNFFHSIAIWCVPAFVMISGALFLNRKSSIEQIYRKNIWRIVTAFIFWSILYAAVSFLRGVGIREAVEQMVKGHYHMWFLFMIVGLYMIVPFLQKITESDELTKYFLLLALVFAFIIPQGIDFGSLYKEEVGKAATTLLDGVNFCFAMGYVGYFVLGYYLNKIELSKKVRICIYILGLIGFATTILGTYGLSMYSREENRLFYGNFTINNLLEGISVFVFFKYAVRRIKSSAKAERIVIALSKYSFGAYLVHAMVLEFLQKEMGLTTLSFHPVVAEVVIAIVVCVISFAISCICNHIPKIKKYIV